MSYSELLLGCGHSRVKKIVYGDNPEWQQLTTLDLNPEVSPDIVWDLENLPLPFEDNSFNEIHAYEVLEHTGSQGDYKFFFAQFSDLWRILKPNGVLIGTVPMWNNPWAWGDPGHKRVITKENFLFLNQNHLRNAIAISESSDYRSIYQADFHTVQINESIKNLNFILKAIKPSRK